MVLRSGLDRWRRGEILTTVVIDADVFDEVFAGLVSQNAEGEVYHPITAQSESGGPPQTFVGYSITSHSPLLGRHVSPYLEVP